MSKRRRLRAAPVAAACLAAAGCGLFRSAPPEPPKPIVSSVCLQTSPQLNFANGTANTLFVRLYQLSTPDTFLQTDPARMNDAGFTLAGAEGAPIEKTLFPGTKTTVEVRQQPDATTLGLVAFYFEASGPVKTRRPLPQRGEPPPAEPPGCIVLGSNGIETP